MKRANDTDIDQKKEKTFYDIADKFIDLANEISRSESPGTIGVAIRYAAARYSAFEVSLQGNNFAEGQNRHLDFFVNSFTEMLQKNFEEYSNL